MRLLKMLPIVGLCAASFLPTSAVADHHLVKIINAESGLCLDATSEGGFVQQSKCDKNLKAQLWTIKGNRIINGHWQNECLDIYVVKTDKKGLPWLNTVQTDACEGWKQAQNWKLKKNGQIQNEYTDQCLIAPGDRPLGPVKARECKPVHAGFGKWEVK
ncbi:MAG: RICIN domain-containing protein [Candidatus Parabeggiatoa sp.]|nr:RICIN domain-containing protein [Candidatus Parabeggiatoa sp.]